MAVNVTVKVKIFIEVDWQVTAIMLLRYFSCIRINISFSGHKLYKNCPNDLQIRALSVNLLAIIKDVFRSFEYLFVMATGKL